MLIQVKPLLAKPGNGYRINLAHPIAAGLNECWEMTEGGGTVIKDVVSGHNGTIAGSITWAWPGSRGGSVLDSAATAGTSYVTLTGVTQLSATKNWSWEGRIKVRAFTDSYGAVLTVNNASGMYIRNTNKFVYYTTGDQSQNGTLTTGVWYDLVLVSKAGAATLYVNGVADSATITTNTIAPGNMFNDTTSETFDGQCEFQRLWQRALSTGEIAALAENPYIFYTAVPKRWWSFAPPTTVPWEALINPVEIPVRQGIEVVGY